MAATKENKWTNCCECHILVFVREITIDDVILIFIQNYIIYYSKNPDAPLSEWEKLIVDGDQRNATISVGDEDTPYTVKVY